MSNKIPKDNDDIYKYYDDDEYTTIITEYVENSIYDDSPKHYIKKLHYEKEINETKDYYYLCTYPYCTNQPVLLEYKEQHNKYFHPSYIDKILYWLCCRF
jgi:hypothetical protein